MITFLTSTSLRRARQRKMATVVRVAPPHSMRLPAQLDNSENGVFNVGHTG